MTEGQRLAAELAASLRATGRYRPYLIGQAIGRRASVVHRALRGGYASVALVEAIAAAAEHVPPNPPRKPNLNPPPSSEGTCMAAELARVLKDTGRYNVSEIARRAGHPRTTVSRVLNGRQGVSVYLVEDLALAAGVDLAYLY